MAARIGFQVQDLIRAEDEITAAEKVSFSSPTSAGFKCQLGSKSINAIVRDKSLKHQGRPWKGSLPLPRISPPKTLGNAVIKNSYNRLRSGQLIPRSFKMALPSTINNPNGTNSIISLNKQTDE
jgi:hypothetical protein